MRKLEIQQMVEVSGGAKQDLKAGFVCGLTMAVGLAVVVASGGALAISVGFAAGAVAPVCATAFASLFFGD